MMHTIHTPTTETMSNRGIAPHNGYGQERIVLPLPPAPHIAETPAPDTRFEMEIYARFMRHLRQVPNSRMEIKILAAIGFTADMMDVSDALIAKTLVDMGLRAPRRAFPLSFLDFADRCAQRQAWDHGSDTPGSVAQMRDHWDRIGEDRFGPMRAQYATFNDGVLST